MTLFELQKGGRTRTSATTARHSVSRSFGLWREFSDDRQCKPDSCHRNNFKLLFTELVLIVKIVALLTTQHSQMCYTCCYSNHNQQVPRGKMLDRWCKMDVGAALKVIQLSLLLVLFLIACCCLSMPFCLNWSEIKLWFFIIAASDCIFLCKNRPISLFEKHSQLT